MRVLFWQFCSDDTQRNDIYKLKKIKQGREHMSKGQREGRARTDGVWGRGSMQRDVRN